MGRPNFRRILMALTLSNIEPFSMGSKMGVLADIAFDASYPTGGEGLTPGDVGLTKIDRAIIEPKSGYVFEYDYSNEKLKALTPLAAGTGTLNLKDDDNAATAGVAVYFDEDGTSGERLRFVSPTNADGSDAAVTIAAAAGAEVADTTDLSGVTSVKATFIGY